MRVKKFRPWLAGKDRPMVLKEALEKIIGCGTAFILKDYRRDWEAGDLLGSLPSGMLARPVHMLPGVYIAAIAENGLMGEVLYRFRSKT